MKGIWPEKDQKAILSMISLSACDETARPQYRE